MTPSHDVAAAGDTSRAATAENPFAADAVEALRAELENLVRIAARRPNLTVYAGEPGCSWAFSWHTDRVRVDPDHLRSLAPDLCRGLALHEAAHAAVTVLQDILPATCLGRYLPLLNVLEDVRIEVWMRSRFPGAAPWIRAYNDVFHGFNRGRSLPRSRQVQFLVGILESWWFGTVSPGTCPEVRDALDACREPIAAATACQPPLDDDAEGIRASQRAMWEIVKRRIVPTWDRLVACDRRDGIGRIAAAETEQFMDRTGTGAGGDAHEGSRAARRRHVRCGRGAGGRRGRRTLRAVPAQATASCRARAACAASPHAGNLDAGGAGETGRRGHHADEPMFATTDGSDEYDRAWGRIAAVADRLGDELLRVLVPRHRLRWAPGHPWGPRLDLRRAMQFAADPRHYDSLWCRPILPERRDPAVLLLVDRSSSMHEDERIMRALEGTVLLTEVCRRIGVPAAVWSFARSVTEELSWDASLDGQARRRLGLLPTRCQGHTDMAAALSVVGRALAARRGDPRLLFVIGDGDPDEHEPTLAAVRRIEADGIATVGLGLGNGTAGLARYFQSAVCDIAPARLVDHVADLLGAALLEPA